MCAVSYLVDVAVTNAPVDDDDHSDTITPEVRTALWASLVVATLLLKPTPLKDL